MNTHHTEKHPNEVKGITVDSKDAEVKNPTKLTVENRYKKMRCYNQMTGVEVGFLGTYSNNVDIIPVNQPDDKSIAMLQWVSYKSDLYLGKDTSPDDRYLGLGANSYACWGAIGGWNDAILYNADHTISLKSKPRSKLYLYGNNWVCWSDENEANSNILRFEMDE